MIVWFLFLFIISGPETRNLPSHPLRPWQTWFSCAYSDLLHAKRRKQSVSLHILLFSKLNKQVAKNQICLQKKLVITKTSCFLFGLFTMAWNLCEYCTVVLWIITCTLICNKINLKWRLLPPPPPSILTFLRVSYSFFPKEHSKYLLKNPPGHKTPQSSRAPKAPSSSECSLTPLPPKVAAPTPEWPRLRTVNKFSQKVNFSRSLFLSTVSHQRRI